MGFLSPLLLALGAAAAVPLLLHLLQRHQGPRVVFPALRYLRRAERESARRVRLRQRLLLLLRLAAVLLLTLAAARPFVRRGGGAHEPTAVAIVLDNSLSTGAIVEDRRVLDALTERALESVDRAGPDDRFWLIRAGSPGEPALAGDAALTAERIRRTEVSAAAADIPAALARARAVLGAGAEGRAREIHLLTDLQATAFPPGAAEGAGDVPVIAWAPREEAPPNTGVAEVSIGGGVAPIAGQRSTASAMAVGTGPDTVALRLSVEGRTDAVAFAPPGAAAVLAFPARQPGLVTGFVETDADALRGDDRRYFAVRVRPAPIVALAQPAPFVEEALAVLEGAGRVRRATEAAGEVVIAPGAVGALAVRRGATAVVLPPTLLTEMPAANRRLAEAGIPWRFTPPAQRGEARFEDEPQAADLGATLENVRLTQVYGLQPVATGGNGQHPAGSGRDSVLLRLQDGSPWALRGTLPGGGVYVLLASPLSPEASTLPTTPAMIPLVERLVTTWAAAEPAETEAVPGEQVALPAGAEYVERPDGERDPVRGSAYYTAPAVAGVYRVSAGGRTVAAFAVNPPAAESELERLSPRRLRTALRGWRTELVGSDRGWRSAIYRNRLGREVWWPLVALALLILLVEAYVATAGRARNRVNDTRS